VPCLTSLRRAAGNQTSVTRSSAVAIARVAHSEGPLSNSLSGLWRVAHEPD
jgi:hypothetical protein